MQRTGNRNKTNASPKTDIDTCSCGIPVAVGALGTVKKVQTNIYNKSLENKV